MSSSDPQQADALDTTGASGAPTSLPGERQAVYWRLLSSTFGLTEQTETLEKLTTEIADRQGIPRTLLDPRPGIDTVVTKHPELQTDFQDLETFLQTGPDAPSEEANIRRGLVYSKMLLNVFGPNTMTKAVSAQQYQQWTQDVHRFERCFGYAPGGLRGKRGAQTGADTEQGTGSGPSGAGPGAGTGAGASTTGSGGGPRFDEDDLRAALQATEKGLIERMALREVLKDNRMAAQLTPSLALVEQLLYDKANLSDNALKNAKALIKQYVDQLAEVLRLQVVQALRGPIDRSVAPKRTFSNLDLKRTIWKNLTNYDPRENRLYVTSLYYRRTARKQTSTRMIVVVDQSGSMVDAMVRCTILASIFAGLPRVDMHLMAFDTEVLDLTPWVHDPFEVLMRTNLGGGTLIRKALLAASEKIEEPRKTAVVLISDFFEGGSDEELLQTILGLRNSGVKFIPVGAVTSSGYFSVSEFFRTRLKEQGMPILTGDIRKLIRELKTLL